MTRPSDHRIKTTFEQTDESGGVTSEIEVTIGFRYYPESGDGWNEPREPAHCEFRSLTHEELAPWHTAEERKLATEMLASWAEQWVDDHQDDCMEVATADDEAAREYAAEARAEQRREDRT